MEARFDAKEFTDYYVERDFPFGEITTELRVVYKMKSGGEEERKHIYFKRKSKEYSY